MIYHRIVKEQNCVFLHSINWVGTKTEVVISLRVKFPERDFYFHVLLFLETETVKEDEQIFNFDKKKFFYELWRNALIIIIIVFSFFNHF